MAQMGQHREAQAYTKQWGRHMKANAHTAEQREQREEYVGSMNVVYNQMGNQDLVEQSAARGSKSKSGGYFGLSSALPQKKIG